MEHVTAPELDTKVTCVKFAPDSTKFIATAYVLAMVTASAPELTVLNSTFNANANITGTVNTAHATDRHALNARMDSSARIVRRAQEVEELTSVTNTEDVTTEYLELDYAYAIKTIASMALECSTVTLVTHAKENSGAINANHAHILPS